MGLLDDAIRDHLDLKRRHGADPAELERAEREALGPVRRKGDVAATGYADDLDVVDEQLDFDDDDALAGSRPPVAYDQAAEDDWAYGGGDEALGVDEPEAAVEPVEPEPPRRRSRRSMIERDAEGEPEAESESDQPRGLAARFGLRGRRTEDEPEVEPELEPDDPLGAEEPTRVHRAEDAGRTPSPTGGETAEHDVDRTPHGDDDDMLEETPEFLQDAPDHDRLWFEQRPPRDFDFDG
jgi:hypothetical protein